MKRNVTIMLVAVIIVIIVFILIYQKNLTGYAVYSPDKIKINLLKDNIRPGENVSFSVDVYDEQNIPIAGQVSIAIEDANKQTRIERIIASGQKTDVQLSDTASFGYWKITASYQDTSNNKIVEDTYLFSVEISENVKFELNDDILTIENMGNAVYEKTIQIAIEDTIGTKNVRLDIGEKTNIRLTAPDGVYSVRVTDGKTTLTRSQVSLTGNVVGVLDENTNLLGSPPLTGGVKPEKVESSLNYLKNKNYIYFFLAVVIGAAVLLAIERNYRRKLGK